MWTWNPKLRIALAALGLLLAAAGDAAAVPYDRLFVFGDSLSDSGNLADQVFDDFGVSLLPPQYYQGRFTDGLNQADILASRLGIADRLTPSREGGTNYAYGYAQTGGGFASPPGAPFIQIPNVGTQIDAFAADLAASGGALDGSDLVLLWAGANDYYFGGATDPTVVVGNLVQHILQLAALGATQFLVPNLPPLGQVPFFNDPSLAPIRDGLNMLSFFHNQVLAGALAQVEASRPDLSISTVDVFGILVGGGGGSAFGFTNVTDAAFVGTIPTGGFVRPEYDGSNYFFWDEFHPSRRAHALLGNVFAQAVPEPSSFALSGLGLAVLGGLAARARRRAA